MAKRNVMAAFTRTEMPKRSIKLEEEEELAVEVEVAIATLS